MSGLRGSVCAAWLALASCATPLLSAAPPLDSPGAATRHVTDAAGRVVTLPATVNRVADPWHANNATVLMLGGADKLVATTIQARRQP